jgi:hypothetical protein
MDEPTPCPHIVQDFDGTAFCDLAESGINSIGGRLRVAERERDEARAENERLRDERNLFGHMLERIEKHYGMSEDFLRHDIEQVREILAESRAALSPKEDPSDD